MSDNADKSSNEIALHAGEQERQPVHQNKERQLLDKERQLLDQSFCLCKQWMFGPTSVGYLTNFYYNSIYTTTCSEQVIYIRIWDEEKEEDTRRSDN